MDGAEQGAGTEIDQLQERFRAILKAIAELLPRACVDFSAAMVEHRQLPIAFDSMIEWLRGRRVDRAMVDELAALAHTTGLELDVVTELRRPRIRPATKRKPSDDLDVDLTGLQDWQVGALIKTVHEARFPAEEDDPVIWLSSFTIELHVAAVAEQRNRVLRRCADRASGTLSPEDDSLRTEHNDENYLEGYARWAAWRGRREHDGVKRRIDQSPDTRKWFAGLSREEVRTLLRPFAVDEDSADDLIAYAARTGPYRPSSGGAVSQPYARSLNEVETPDGWVEVYEVAVLLPGASKLGDREVTDRPEEALLRRGFAQRDSRDCAQNARRAGRGQPVGWRGVGVDEVWAGS